MRNIILIFLSFFFNLAAIAQNKQAVADSMMLKLQQDSLNSKIKPYAVLPIEFVIKKNGDVKINNLYNKQQFSFNFFELGSESQHKTDGKIEGKHGIELEYCDPRAHSATSTISFTSAKGSTIAFIKLRCMPDKALKPIYDLLLKIRNRCIEEKDYLK